MVTSRRSFEAASFYKGKKIAVLDFASSKHPGGSPWSSGAQEESLCRCSTLQECLVAAKPKYHDLHNGLGKWGTNDLIYIPKVCVFKSDESAPLMLKKEDRFFVDIIVSAAPHFGEDESIDEKELEKVLTERLTRVFQVAKDERVDVLILGAYGCGAFHNPPEITAKVFKKLINRFEFPTIEFAIDCSRGDTNYKIFKKVLES